MSQAITVIPDGIDFRHFRPNADARASTRRELGFAEDDLVALFVGGDWGRKGLRAALAAIALTAGWNLWVVGDGDIDGYSRLAESIGANGRVRFVGRQRSVARFYAAADAFVLPSSYETFSMATYEAAAVGLPLLVSPVGGVVDVLVDGVNGWFIGTDPEEIAQRLDELAESEELKQTMSAAARKAVEDFGWERVVDDYLRMYAR
jgi:UDP-glucose:(heptosyl)LPS alpha-1,3-glucosyltransferase